MQESTSLFPASTASKNKDKDKRREPPPLPTADRRRHPRYLLTLAITLEGDNNFYAGLTEDISESGIFIATSHILPIGTPVAMKFTLPGTREPMEVQGTVQWIREPGAVGGDRHVKPGMGVKFQNIDKLASSEIRWFMRTRLPEFYA